ncbi:MAG: putative DNA-binding domain-containing protein [Methylibium sp.]|uniref:HvfC/BufC N-terminal domain-containing protein n=1 Tax=Methylibium sp. TaxID=2067992 RepID=UPI001838C394|nr:DNA-binding domain-containing protein [Methylibium sp.]MBA2721415.1 putative DNA-binding domain-containing protein [Methylibium sp.]MBA3590887.1 putative DNA-binding domain-containing protein [Methylibium sp.]
MIAAPAQPTQRAFAESLIDAARPVPAGMQAWNGSDVSTRFAVYRNNVIVSLLSVMAETFPVVRRLVGEPFFNAMAQLYVCEHPPTSPVMTEYGDGFAGWVAAFEPAAALPYLADMARLERARVQAYHAADAPALPAQTLAQASADPGRLPTLRLPLHPSLTVLHARHAVVSLWAAHQHDHEDDIGRIEVDQAECALVLRDDDEVLVLPLAAADAALIDGLRQGGKLGEAVIAARGADLPFVLTLLLQHGALIATPMTEDTS